MCCGVYAFSNLKFEEIGMAKLTWLAGLALGAVMLGGCGQTQSGDQEPSATAGGNTDPLSITSDASEKHAET